MPVTFVSIRDTMFPLRIMTVKLWFSPFAGCTYSTTVTGTDSNWSRTSTIVMTQISIESGVPLFGVAYNDRMHFL
jgi:hypothetical protein